MARQVLPIVGAIVGSFFGAPQLGFAIGSIVGNAIDPQIIKGPKLGEAGLQTSAEGVYRPVVLGTGPVKGNIIERGNRQVKTSRTRQGKGGGPVTEQQRVYWTFAIRLAEGPIGGVLRIWQDEKLVYDVTPDTTIGAESAEFAQRFRLYLGDESQLPDPDLEVIHGMGNANAYRGTAYIVFPNFDLTDFRERVPDFRFEVSSTTGTSYNYLFLMHMDSELLVDEVSSNVWGGGLWQTDIKKFGVGSRYINIGGVGEGGAQTLATETDFASIIGTSDFMFSGWIIREMRPGRQADTIMGHWFQPGTRSFAWQIWREDGGDTMFVRMSADGDNFIEITSSTIVPYDEWVYVALSRENGLVRMFLNGVMVGSGMFPFALHSNAGMDPGRYWRIGGFDQINVETALLGWVDEFVGILGDPIYTDDFTPPTEPWPNPTSGSGNRIGLDDIVTFLHERADQDVDYFDVSELTDEVDGIVFAGDYTCADAVRTLMPLYFFDGPEYDDGTGYKIRYVLRGKPVVATITDDDLLEAPERTVREDALERPLKLHVHYESPSIGYAPAKATVTRDSVDVRVVGEVSMQVPVSFSDVTEIRQRAHKLHKITWVEVSGVETMSLPDNWLELIPSDCIGLSLRGEVRRVRLLEEQSIPGSQQYRMILDRQSAYTSDITGIPLPAPTPPPPSIIGQTIFEFLDIPALNDNNDSLLYYLAATGQTEAWYGAQIQRAVPPDTAFSNINVFTQNTIMGTLVDLVASASEHYIDTTNVVEVQLYTPDVIEALTDQQFLSEGGSFALEKPDGSFEVMQYRDVEETSAGTFVMSYLARGRLNSGPSAHLVGARFVLLDGVQSTAAVTAYLGNDLIHRPVSFGTSPELAPTYTDEYIGRSQIEFPVADLTLDRSGDTISATTVERRRFGTEDNPVRSANWQGFRWVATDGLNTITTDTISTTTSFDVTGWASPIQVTVSQVNRFTGPGPTVSESIA